MKPTTKEENEIVKQYIKELKKLNSKGLVKILETDSKADIEDNSKYRDTVIPSYARGTFVDVALYVYSR